MGGWMWWVWHSFLGTLRKHNLTIMAAGTVLRLEQFPQGRDGLPKTPTHLYLISCICPSIGYSRPADLLDISYRLHKYKLSSLSRGTILEKERNGRDIEHLQCSLFFNLAVTHRPRFLPGIFKNPGLQVCTIRI